MQISYRFCDTIEKRSYRCNFLLHLGDQLSDEYPRLLDNVQTRFQNCIEAANQIRTENRKAAEKTE